MTIFDLGVSFGLGFSLGVIQALVFALVVLWFINKVVDFIWAKTTFQKYKFKTLPSCYKSMELHYSVRSKLLVASATLVIEGVEHKRFRTIYYPKADHSDELVTNLQLTLMSEIAEEFHDAIVTGH